MMLKGNFLVLILVQYWLSLYPQSIPVKFNSIQLSQNSNAYYYVTSEGLMMISSTDGLNIFDGLHTHVYRPLTHNMIGNNVQSTFFEDTSGYIWFTTYEALHRYHPGTDQFQHWFLTSTDGDTLKENYKAFLLDNNQLYLKAGEEVFVFDISNQTIQSVYPINFSEVYFMAVTRNKSTMYLLGGSDEGYSLYELGRGNKSNLLHTDSEYVSYVCQAADNLFWIGFANGDLALYDPSTHNSVFRQSIAKTPVGGIALYGDDKLFVTVSRGDILEFDIQSRKVINHIVPLDKSTLAPAKRTYSPFITTDSTLIVGCDGQGVFFYNLKKQKFNHFLDAHADLQQVSVARILQRSDHTYIVLTRKSGIILMDQDGQIITQWPELPSGVEDFSTLSGILLDDDTILFSAYYHLYLLSISTKKIVPVKQSSGEKVLQFDQINLLPNGTIIVGAGEEGLFALTMDGHTCNLTPFTDVVTRSKLVTNFKTDLQGNLYVSNDQINILVYTPIAGRYAYTYTLPIRDGVLSIVDDPQRKSIYITNYNGIYHLDLITRKHTRVLDPKNHLLQTLYAGMMDEDGDIWLSSNTGLLKYTPNTGEVIVFSEMDGVQASEYNSHAYLKREDGTMMFGGINGLNVFHPKEVHLSQREAPVYISEVLINDEPDFYYSVSHHVDIYKLPYHRNTISFEFHAIDYSDPAATHVRYKLLGVDDEYVESRSSQGFARYAHLQPGDYTLLLLGRNADGVWNQTPREIFINIKPPFWLTWWFIALSSLTVISLMYWMVRSYYRRKLEKKNQLLREQSLIIKNQQAIEHERTRIASEMHDDLGSGLTTIRYLSDKALMQAKDPEEVEQIQRIADHSNTLVRNMSEIIWAMNSRFDDAENLAGYLRRYASEYLEERMIPFSFDIVDEQLTDVNVRGEVRRNLFLVFKEVLHNTVKYSAAAEVIIQLRIEDQVSIKVSEIGGKGFEPTASEEKGNGLYNIRKRMKAIHGHISFEKTPDAMHIIFSAPINA